MERKERNQKKWLTLIFFLYLLLLIKLIVFKYPLSHMQEIVDSWQKDVILEGLQSANFTPFKTIKMYIRYYELPGLRSFANLFGNVLIFVPVGMMLPLVCESGRNVWFMLLYAFVFIVGIEVFQLFSAFGAFDVDDIILNMTGVLVGRALYLVFLNKN